MDFGVLVFPKPDRCVDHAKLAEAQGFSHVWVEDSPMMAGDVYLCLGLMAQHTTRVTLGTGVAVVGNAQCARGCPCHCYGQSARPPDASSLGWGPAIARGGRWGFRPALCASCTII